MYIYRLLNSSFLTMGLQMLYQDKDLPEDSDKSCEDFYDGEILDEMTTNRGEVKLRAAISFNDRNQSFNGRNQSFNGRNLSFNGRSHNFKVKSHSFNR